MKLLLLFLYISPALCHEWIRKEAKFDFLSEKLIYRNRADCAAKSKTPTRHVFLMIDNVNIAKAAYRLAKIKEIDPGQTTNLAIEKFRYGITKLTSSIGGMLLTGALPLITDEKSSEEVVRLNWSQRLHTSKNDRLRCRRIKKFGSLHSTLNVSRPDHFLLQELGNDLENIGDTFQSCDDFSDDNSPDVDLFRFDVISDASFEQTGFHFWASLKVYLSWALRFSPEMAKLTAPFDQLIRNADFEEMLLFLSAGCESISSPECSDRDLSLDSLQELTEPIKDFSVEESSFHRQSPQSPADHLFSRPLPLKEDDLLHLGSFQSTDEWVENFRDNFLKTRGYQKIRLTRATSNLSVLAFLTTFKDINERLLVETQMEEKEWREQLFYLCTEFNGASHSYFSSLEKELSLIKKDHSFFESIQDLDERSLEEMIQLYFQLTSSVKDLCLGLEEKKTWEGMEINRSGLAPWYLQLSGSPVDLQLQNVKGSKGISNSFIKINDTEIFCQSGIHCSRILLDSLMTLTSVLRSLPVLLPTEVSSVNLGNPYASRVACGIYDPWEKRNKMIYNFFHDLAQSAVFGLVPSPIYVSMDLDPKKVTSFKSLLKEGKVFYDPIYSKKKMHLSLITDLGPLIGVPCAISISGSRINPLEYYSFNGISFSGCRESGRNDVRVSSEDELERDVSFNQVCGACAINLRTVSTAVGRLHPAIRFSSFLLKGVVRLLHARRDPHDIPKSFVLNPQHVALSYRYWGNITPWCSKKILKGESCLPSCERKMMETLTARYDVSPTSSDFNCFLQKGTVRVKECDAPLFLSNKNNLLVKSNCTLKERKR